MEFEDHHRRLFICGGFPSCPGLGRLGQYKRSGLIYLAGGLFALSWWLFIDAVIQSNMVKENPSKPFVEDYIVGSFATLGMIIVNSLDPNLIAGKSFTYSESGVASKARFFLFCGITANAGSFIGAVAVACFKYYFPASPVAFVGTALIVQTLGILISCIALWTAQSMDSDNTYNITLG